MGFIKILRHDCSIQKMVQLSNGEDSTSCPFYFKMWGAYCFNFLGIRIIIGNYK